VTFAEIAEALASVDVSAHDPEWCAEWWYDRAGPSRRGSGRSSGPSWV
jgi:hypothetical protein